MTGPQIGGEKGMGGAMRRWGWRRGEPEGDPRRTVIGPFLCELMRF